MRGQIGTISRMARKSKPLGPLDESIELILRRIVEESGLSQRDLEKATGILKNRVGIIL